MPINSKVKKLYDALKADGGDVGTPEEFNSWFFKPGKEGYKNRKSVYDTFKADGADVGKNYEEFGKWLGLHAVYPTVNKYRQQMFKSVDPNKSRASELTHRAVGQAARATNNVRKPVTAKVLNRKGKPTGNELAITPAKTVEDLDREYAQETTKNWENELHDQMADADRDAAKISDMFKSFIGSTDEVGSVWGNMTRGGGIAGTPHSVTTNNGILENTEARQILAAGDYNRKRRELLQLEQDSRLSKDTSLLGGVKKAYNDIKNGEFSKAGKDLVYGAGFDNHSFFRGMYDAAKDTGFLTGGASDLINAGSLLATKQDLDNGVHTEAGDTLMQQAVKNSNAQSQYGDNQGWMYTGGVITTNMAPFMVQIGSAGFSEDMSNAIGKVVQGTASKVALGTMEKATGMAGAHIANYIGKVTGLTTKAFGKAVQYGIVGAAQANTVGLGNVANDVINRYTGQVYQDEQGSYKFGTFDSDGNLVHEGGEDFLTSLVKGDAAQTIEFATELAGGGIDAVGTALKNFVTKGGKKIINKYNMENVSKVIDFLLNNKVSKNARYLKAGADRTLGKVELNSIVGESLEEELGIIANTVFTGDNKISDLWNEKQQSQIWGGMLLSIGLMKGAVAPFYAYNAKQYYSYKHNLDKADVNLSQLLGKEKWEELRNQIDATTNDDMPEMVNKINRDVALGKNRQPVREYIQNLLIMRGYDIGNMLAAKKAVEDKGEGVSVKNMEKNQAYQQGRGAYGYDTHEIQLDQEEKQKSLAQLLGISEQQLASMSDEELEALSGRDDNIDRAIYDYQLSTGRYEGVIDNARDQIDLEVQRAAQAVDMYTDKSRNTIRNATIKATGGLEDYGVYIINGNIATHEDGSIDISNSDDMILYYDPTTNTVEHADAMMFAELGSEENADEVRSQAMADAKEKAIKETTGIIDGVVEVGTQFKTVDADGTEHTYEVLADNGDGTAMITIDGNIPTELVKGENVNVPVSFEELQKMKDESDQQRLQAAKAQREQMEKERAEQQMQAQNTQAENPSQEDNIQPAPIEDNLDYSDIIRDDGKVQMVDVSDKDGNNLFPDAKDVFYIQGNKMRTKFAYIDANGELKTQSFPTGLVKIKTRGEVSVDDYKKYRNMILSAESSAMPETSMIEDNSGEESDEDSQLENLGLPKGSEVWMSSDGFGRPKENTLSRVVGIDEHGSIILEDKDGKKWSASFDYINNHRELPPLDENTNIVNEENNQSESNAEENTPAPEQTPAMTLEDGTIVPMLEDGNPDFSKLTAAQTAELYDTQFGEDADSIVSGYVSDAKKALDKASNMTVKGKNFVEQKAAKDAKEKAIADAQAAYDSAIAIRDAYNERQLAKVEDTAEGRKELIEKARRKFARLKSAVKDDAEAVSQLYRDTIGSLLHRLYDSTGIDVTDTTPLTAEEYVASNLGAHSLNYEGTETSKGVKQETGLSREDFAKTQLLAADGKGTTIDSLVHSLWENRPSNLESLDTQDIRNALIGVLNSGFKASEARNFVENIRIAQAENILEEQKRAQENAAYAEQHKAEPEAELKAKSDEKAELKAKSEEKLDNESSNESNDLDNDLDNEKKNDNINDNINVPEDATDENPLGAERDESDLPFSAKENGKQQTTAERAADVEKNKVDDMKVVDNIVGEKTRKAFERLSKMMGANIQWQYSDKLGNGWIQETTDADGNVHRTIFITLDSSITEGAQFIFGHEMTHQIKNLNPAAYNELTQLVLDTYGSDAFDKAVDETMQRYSDAGFSGRARDYYAEEVVADAVGEMIRDLNLAHTLAMKMSHPLLAAIHEILQKIKLAFFGTEYSDVTKNIIRSIEQAYVKTANGEVTNSETGEDVSFSLRQKPEPKKKGIGYKVFVLKDGKLYPPMVANPDGAATPVGVWLDADAAPIAGESKTGRPQVKQGGKGTQGGSGKLAYRPGWHLGVVPYAIQFNRKDAEGNKTLFPKNFVFAEVEYAADVDYQEEARQEGINPSGKYQHSLAGLKHLPTDGYYMYRTNPNPETDPWVITGAMKVNRILTRAEQAELVKNAGREPQQIQEGDIVTDDVVNSINQEIADAPKFSLKVYHGSGADFTEFDFDHMGEGAGSQVFGWGGYVASSKKIGKSYVELTRKKPTYVYNGKEMSEDDLRSVLLDKVGIDNANILDDFLYNLEKYGVSEAKSILRKGDYAYFKDLLKGTYGSVRSGYQNKVDAAELILAPRNIRVKKYKGNLYEVDIPDDNGRNYLDWDKPLRKEQQDAIREGLEHLGVGIKTLESKGQSLERTGENVYNSTLYIGLTGTEYDLPERTEGISKFLSSVGFTGIKYKAGRNFGGAKEGDTNYVIFKPEDMKITEHTKFSLRLKSAIEETETNPSDAQKESGNYKKGHIKFGGYDYTIENPKGSTRSGKDADGKEWKVTMHDTYGYIRGKFGKDGDHLDMFINDKADLDNWNGDVFVVDQVNPDGSFDEHKVMYGYDSMDDAKKAYLANYSDGWKGLGNITGVSKDEFDKWLDTSKRKLKPFADYAKVKFSLKDIKPVGVGAFGNIYNQFRGNAKAAIEFLKKIRGGEAVGALHHKDIGDIDLVWGKEGTGHSDGYGLSKLVKYHPEVLDNLQEILNDMRVVSSSKNRVNLESETHKAGVRLTWDGERKSWLLTAFKKETSASDKRTDTAATSLEGDTALSQTEGSAAKIDNSFETAKENVEKFSLKDEKIKSVAEKFGVNEDDVAMYANAVERGSTADAARARANIKRYLLQANEDKISSFKELMKYTVPVNEALKENFGDLDAMIEERRKQVEAERNAMESARKRAQEEEEKRQKHLDELSLIPTDELDKRYMDAIANNDESTAREMLDESARRKGYGDADSDYQGQGAWAAPSNPQYESDEARRADIENSPDVNLEDIALGYNLQPDDYFDNPRAYMNNTAHGLESAHVIKNALDAIKNGEKDVKVKVYRAVPTSVKEGKLRNGDRVTPSKKYAEMHGDNRLEGKYRIIEDEVSANQLWWDGNDANEFGFDDGKEYRYKNAKNNRKLNDLITYDNKGNVIPPSKRFNSRKNDIRFSLRGSTPYDKQMEEWMEKNHLEKGAVPMEKPIMKEGENIFDYANRMVEWTRNQNLWKTAPKQTGFQDALDKWKADNGLSPDAYPPVRPHRENYSTEIGYAEDLEEYNKKKELWKSAPKPKDFDLSVDLEDMNKQLRNIRRAVLNQKNYDQRAVKAVSDLVRKMLNIGWGDGLSRGKVGNLLSAAKNATGANDVKKYLDKAMGILAENYLNRLSTAYDNLINTKGARADQSGVIKIGSLDAKGQAFMSEYKKAINMDDSSLNTYIANIEEDSAKNEDNVEMNDYRLAGIQAAIMYKQQIGGNDADISELKRQIGELKNKKDATKEDKDLLKSLEKKLFENKFDRITMYENLLNNIQRMVKESKGRAKEFREEIAEHKNEILHRANLDLEGVDSTYYDTTTAKKKFVNNDLQRAVFSSTYTFEQFLKFFGKHSANGEGRLYNYFHKLNQDALDEEQLYNEMNRNALDEKTKELFGKNKFMNLVGVDGKGMKEMDVEVTDYSNKETGKRTIHLKQGQMLYIYLVNKETDGEMKLRAMGITEEDVAAIEENLDPRVKAMGEWLQDEYLPECQRRYQATHTKYFGAPMKEVENYFPLAINNRARNVKEDVNQDSDAMSQLAGTSTGAIVTRRVNVIPLDIENADAFEVAFNHLQEMEEWSAMLPFRQDINTLLSYTHFRNQVQNMSSVAYGSGKTLWDEFKQTAQIAAGTYKPKVNAGMMDSRIAAAMGGVAVAKISGRLWTAIKQSQSATVFLPECDFTRFVKNGVNPYGSWKWAMENIPDFRKRVENMTYGDVKLRQYLDELEKWHDWTKTISKIGMAPNILVDGITCAVGARSVYETEVNRLTKLGYPMEKAEEKAYYKAVAAYNKTQQSSGGMYLSPMQVDRTYVSAALSLFKNANYAYGRMQIEACRGLARTYDLWGGKHKTTLIESMTRQIMEEDGLDENTARAIAKATYNITFRQSIGRLINFATLVPVSWALYKVLPYLLTGDDDDKKKDMIEEAVLKGFATSLSDNYVIPFASNILNAGLKVEDGKPTFDPEVFRYQNLYINPATSDLSNIYSMVGNQKWYSVANKLGMLGVQSLIGFNPETVGALYQALSEADYDNGNTAKEWQIGILKAISAPEESIRELYMDELGLKSGDIKKIPLAELEKRYAERQINRDNLLSQIGMDAETFNGYVDKYQKSFEKKIKDKMDKWDEYDKKKADEFFDTTSDPKLKDMIEKKRTKDANAAADEQIAKEGLNQENKGKEPSEEAYDAVKMSIDVAEDNAISTYNKVLNKRYAALNDEYNEQTDAMKYIFMSKHPNFKAYKELESEYTKYGKKIKELKGKMVSADGYDVKQAILKQIRAEREKFSELQSKVR